MRVEERLVDVWVEGIPRLAEGFQTVLGRDPLDLLRDSLEAAIELVVLTSRMNIIKHGKEILQHALNRHLASKITITVDASLVVDVFSLKPLQVRGSLGQLVLEFCHFRLKISNRGLALIGRG
jgi:hypothetical protein